MSESTWRRPCHNFAPRGNDNEICLVCGYHVSQHHDAAKAYYASEAAKSGFTKMMDEERAVRAEQELKKAQGWPSPEEFVVGMAEKVMAVPPWARSHFLHSLGEIQRHVLLVREHLSAEDQGVFHCSVCGADRPGATPCEEHPMMPLRRGSGAAVRKMLAKAGQGWLESLP